MTVDSLNTSLRRSGWAVARRLAAASLACAALSYAGTAGAVVTSVYTTAASFADALSGASLLVDTWSGGAYSGNGYGFTLTSPSAGFAGNPVGVDASGAPVSGGSDSAMSNNNASNALTFSSLLGSPTAFGGYFFPVNVTGKVIPGTISVTINGVLQTSSSTTASSVGPVPFLGFVSDVPITSVLVKSTDPTGYFPAIDRVTLGTAVSPVPEPSPAMMWAVAVAFAGVLRLRRKTGA
jgi:hypothetical protein